MEAARTRGRDDLLRIASRGEEECGGCYGLLQARLGRTAQRGQARHTPDKSWPEVTSNLRVTEYICSTSEQIVCDPGARRTLLGRALQLNGRRRSSVKTTAFQPNDRAGTNGWLSIRKLRTIGAWRMKATFVELPAFERYRAKYLDDAGFIELQSALMRNPEAGDVIEGTGGLRKMRFVDRRRGKGKRSGLRVVFYWWTAGDQFWLFTLYDKDEMRDLTAEQRKALKSMIKAELEARRRT
jgi:hypothetical protein